jgi:hypothetical protein
MGKKCRHGKKLGHKADWESLHCTWDNENSGADAVPSAAGSAAIIVPVDGPADAAKHLFRRCAMTTPDTPLDNALIQIVDEQLQLAASNLPALAPTLLHPSPLDHEEIKAPHPGLDDVLLGHTPAPLSMLDELAELQDAPALSDEELARQALADGGGDGDPATPE